MARMLLKAMREKQIKDKEEERREYWQHLVTGRLPVVCSCCTAPATRCWVHAAWLLLAIVHNADQ
jgi:hypothetical protein